jgi:FMN phosphatase YigB (HAD superfamily)
MIRLVIFDFGDTLFHAEEDARSVATGEWVVLDKDEEGFPTTLAPPARYGMAEFTFPHVQSTLRDLHRKGIWLSVASSADPTYTPFMIDAFGMSALFRHPFMAEKGDYQGNCCRKGEWVEAIIHDFNIAECMDWPLEPQEILFVDDLTRCLMAVKEKVPGIHVVMSMPRTEEGLKYIFDVIDEINRET